MVFVGTMVFSRLISLLRRIRWRNDLGNEFPEACGDWAENRGCTRVTLNEDGCTRAEDIAMENSLIFNVIGADRLLNTQIDQCVI